MLPVQLYGRTARQARCCAAPLPSMMCLCPQLWAAVAKHQKRLRHVHALLCTKRQALLRRGVLRAWLQRCRDKAQGRKDKLKASHVQGRVCAGCCQHRRAAGAYWVRLHSGGCLMHWKLASKRQAAALVI